MIKIENIEAMGFGPAIRGMRNPMNSWDKSDSTYELNVDTGNWEIKIGQNDHDLMMRLAKVGSTHAKYRRMITVYANITAPLYWWKEFDTYKVGTVANSCSTMHKIHDKEFTLDDFSCEHLYSEELEHLEETIKFLNASRDLYIDGGQKNKRDWWQMIQLLPSSYNQKRTVMLNYEALANMYHDRKDHKLDEWREFCQTIKSKLPYSELFIVEE